MVKLKTKNYNPAIVLTVKIKFPKFLWFFLYDREKKIDYKKYTLWVHNGMNVSEPKR